MAYCSVDVDAPSSGRPGEVIEAIVTVTNLDTTTDWLFTTEIWVGTELIDSIPDGIPAGTSKTYRRYFTMPGSKVTVLAWVERLVSLFDAEHEYCSSASADVALAVEPEYVGTISRKELEYNGNRASIPVS